MRLVAARKNWTSTGRFGRSRPTQGIIPGRAMRPGLKAIRPIQETTTGSIDLFVGEHLQETSGNQVLFTIKSRVSTVFFPINFPQTQIRTCCFLRALASSSCRAEFDRLYSDIAMSLAVVCLL